MIRYGVRLPEIESGYLRKILKDKIRLDGRGPQDFREVSINLSRSESSSTAEVAIGSTLAIAVVKGTICSPYHDRPTEGILQINTNVSVHAQSCGVSRSDISRYLEKTIRESDAIDTESLCLVAGEKVWMIVCEVELINYCGSGLDACMLASIAALRAHRRPDVTVINVEHDLKIHPSDDREPLPLALHHTPLTVTVGLFSVPSYETLSNTKQLQSPEKLMQKNDSKNQVEIICDLTDSEELASDGVMSFSINAHKELCAIYKPGGISVDIATVLSATKLASTRTIFLHTLLTQSLNGLEEQVKQQRAVRLEWLRNQNQLQRDKSNNLNNRTNSDDNDNTTRSGQQHGKGQQSQSQQQQGQQSVRGGGGGGGGIDRDDPILDFNILHKPFVYATDHE